MVFALLVAAPAGVAFPAIAASDVEACSRRMEGSRCERHTGERGFCAPIACKDASGDYIGECLACVPEETYEDAAIGTAFFMLVLFGSLGVLGYLMFADE